MLQRLATVTFWMLFCFAGPSSAQVAQQVDIPVKQWMFVGFTQTHHVVGDIGGMMGAAQKCQADFEASRMCTQREFIFDSIVPVIIDPEQFGVVWDHGDSLALNSPTSLHGACDNFSRSNSFEICAVIDGAGATSAITCSESAPIACCALKKVPEPRASLQIGAGVVGLAAAVKRGSKTRSRPAPRAVG